ncbi:MAG: hypothetical protein AB1566_12065 [Chloroflexota bacterium]
MQNRLLIAVVIGLVVLVCIVYAAIAVAFVGSGNLTALLSPPATYTPASTATPADTATPTPTRTLRPTNTPFPTDTPFPTSTPKPTATSTFTPRPIPPRPPTLPPTATPTPTPAYDFMVVTRDGPSLQALPSDRPASIFIKVLDMSGRGISGIPVRAEWCCPADSATKSTDASGALEFALSRGDFTITVADGVHSSASTSVSTAIPDFTGKVTWNIVFKQMR